MARIKYTGLVSSINGTIAGTTFQRNAYGFTVKGKPNMVKPWTDFQQQQKNLMSAVTKAWRNLTDAQRLDWQTFAEANPRQTRLNPDAFLSGYNLFLMYHRYRTLTNLGFLTSPSLVLGACDPPEYIVNYQAGVLTWETNPSGIVGTWTALLFLTNVIPLGREFVNVTPRFMDFNDYDIGRTKNIANQFQLKLGQLPPVNEFVGIRMVVFNQANAQVIVAPVGQTQVISL